MGRTLHSNRLMSLEEAACRVAEFRGPTRVRYRSPETTVGEVFFYGDLVVHAFFDGVEGEDAVLGLLALRSNSYDIQRGVSPAQHSLLVPWGSLLARATLQRDAKPRVHRPQIHGPRFSIKYDRDEATARLAPRKLPRGSFV